MTLLNTVLASCWIFLSLRRQFCDSWHYGQICGVSIQMQPLSLLVSALATPWLSHFNSVEEPSYQPRPASNSRDTVEAALVTLNHEQVDWKSDKNNLSNLNLTLVNAAQQSLALAALLERSINTSFIQIGSL